jgi:hypothetical protein
MSTNEFVKARVDTIPSSFKFTVKCTFKYDKKLGPAPGKFNLEHVGGTALLLDWNKSWQLLGQENPKPTSKSSRQVELQARGKVHNHKPMNNGKGMHQITKLIPTTSLFSLR